MVRKITGFSLIELLILLALIGIMLLIAIPRFFSWKEKLGAASETKQIFSLLEKYRSYAFFHKTDINMEFNKKNLIIKDILNNKELNVVKLKYMFLDNHNNTNFSIKISKRGTFKKNMSLHTSIETTPNCLVITFNNVRMGTWDEKKKKCIVK